MVMKDDEIWEKYQEMDPKCLKEILDDVAADFGLEFGKTFFILARKLARVQLPDEAVTSRHMPIADSMFVIPCEILEDKRALRGYFAHECGELVKRNNPIYRKLNGLCSWMRRRMFDEMYAPTFTNTLLLLPYFVLRFAMESYIDKEAKKRGYEQEIEAIRKYYPKIPKEVLK
jgi:hypothetical protein